MNSLNRYIWLIDTISQKNGITFEEISEKWQNSVLNSEGGDFPLRTFHNHRKAIAEIFGILTECDKKKWLQILP